jgi:hypothetical protein
MATARQGVAGAGADNTSGLAFGGYPMTSNTESWNGTNWTEVNNLNTTRQALGGAGIQTSALGFAGIGPPGNPTTETELWNGTNWTEVNDMNTSKRNRAGCGATNTAVLGFGGGPPSTADTELWNGTNWTEVNNMNSGKTTISRSRNIYICFSIWWRRTSR